MKKIFTVLIYFLFILAGFFFAYALSGFQIHAQEQEAGTDTVGGGSELEPGKVLYSKTYNEYSHFEEELVSYGSNSSKKLTIEESAKIYSDKTEVETGEEVQFWATLKNNNLKMKHLTHVCFNHSGGVNFFELFDP